jgi:Fe-S-cluster containining protein
MIGESMCDRCMSPGACCKRIHLSGGSGMKAIGEPMSHERAEHLALEYGLWMMRPAHQNDDGRWQWNCTQLGPDGRCQIYEDRPELCRSYRPGQDGLCVHYWPDEEEGIPS